MRRNRTDYAINRYYSPDTGRFTTHDPLTELDRPDRLNQPQGLNLYPYVMGAPTRYTDPDGLDWGRSKKADANNKHEIKWFPEAVDSDYETKPVGWIFYDDVQNIRRMCGAGGRFIDLDFAGYPIPPPPPEPGETGSAKPWAPLEFDKAGGSNASCTSGGTVYVDLEGQRPWWLASSDEVAAHGAGQLRSARDTPSRLWGYVVAFGDTFLRETPNISLDLPDVEFFVAPCQIGPIPAYTPIPMVDPDQLIDDGLAWAGDGENVGAVLSDVVALEGIGRVATVASAGTAGVSVDGVGTISTAGSSLRVNPTGGTMNCVNCAIATDAKLAGNLASAMPGKATPISVLEKLFGRKFQPVSGPMQIGSMLSEAGNGSRGIVYGASKTGDVGHVWNVINQNGTIRFLDGQTGATGAKAVRNFDDFSNYRFLFTIPK